MNQLEKDAGALAPNPLPDLSEYVVYRVEYYAKGFDWTTGQEITEKLAVPRRTRVA